MAERGIVFPTAPPALAAAIVDDVRARFGDVAWTVHEPGAPRDRSRYDMVVVAWTGHPLQRRTKLTALLRGRRPVVYDEHLDCFHVRLWDASWLGHLRRRFDLPRGVVPVLARGLGWLYRWTLGLVLGTAWTAARAAVCTARRGAPPV